MSHLMFRYQVLTLPEEDGANCLFVNGTLIHIDSYEASESAKVQIILYHKIEGQNELICIFHMLDGRRNLF